MPYFDAFRFPKMMFDKNINLHYAAKETLKPCLAGMARMYVIPAEMAFENFQFHSGSQIFNSSMECATKVWVAAYPV
eukprot:scaffold199369_cov14-Tisochrysis_lutea.AAC.1